MKRRATSLIWTNEILKSNGFQKYVPKCAKDKNANSGKEQEALEVIHSLFLESTDRHMSAQSSLIIV